MLTEFVLTKHSNNNVTTSSDCESTPINKIQMFFGSPFWRSECTTNNGPTSSTSVPHRRSQISVCQHKTGLFCPFYIEDKQSKIEKAYGLIFPWLVTRAVHLETSPDLNTETSLNANRRFTCWSCQPILLYSGNGKKFVGASEELKSAKALDKGKFFKTLAAVETTWKFNPL